MAVHALLCVLKNGEVVQQKSLDGTSVCFAIFQQHDYPDPEDVEKVEILIPLRDQKAKGFAEAFVKGRFFQELTEGKITLESTVTEWPMWQFRGGGGLKMVTINQEPGLRYYNKEAFAKVTLDPTLDVSRTVTALRYLKVCNYLQDAVTEGIPLEEFPFWYNAYNIHRVNSSDGWVTNVAITSKDLYKYFEDHKEDNDWDSLEEMWFDDALEDVPLFLTKEMLLRVLNRTTEEFKALVWQENSPLLGYIKDDEQDWEELAALPDDFVLTIGAPVADRPREGEVALKETNFNSLKQFYDHCNA